MTVIISSDLAGVQIIAKATTDANGRYSFTQLPDVKGAVRVVAEAPGFGRAEHTMVIARNYRNIWDAGIPLARLTDTGHRVAGAVVDAQKRPVSDATVSLLRPQMDGNLIQLRTDAAGRFLFDNVDPGEYVVIVTRPAYEAASRLVSATASGSGAAAQAFTVVACKRCPTGESSDTRS